MAPRSGWKWSPGMRSGVTWISSYVGADRTRTFEIYDGPDADAIRRAAERNGLPIERITAVMVLDPYAYR